MKAGIHVTNFTWPGGAPAIAPTLAQIARAADEGGFDHLSLMDHYFQLDGIGGPDAEMLEGYTTLGYLAAVTMRIPLGLLVTGVTSTGRRSILRRTCRWGRPDPRRCGSRASRTR